MIERRTYYFSILVLMALCVPVLAGVEKKDPALEAIQALEQEMSSTLEAPQPPDAADTDPAASATGEAAVTDPAETMPADVTVLPAAPAEVLEMDIVLVLDNSGSMKKNDPQFFASRAVEEFINNLQSPTHIAVIIFDQDVRLAFPLEEINDISRADILRSIEQINYKGLYTNIPDAIERAIYELKNSGRTESSKSIIFLTDGIVDTGNAALDQEKTAWLKDTLAADAADEGIAVYGIAFTEQADFQLIQSLAQKTDGEYFRALTPEELSTVYDKVQAQIAKAAIPPPPPPVAAPPPPVYTPAPPPPPPAPVIIEVPVQQPEPQQQLSPVVIVIVLAVLIVAVIFLVISVMRGRVKGEEEVVAQEAYLKDTHGYTSQASYQLGNKPAMLGRAAGTDTEHMDYIVIPQTTIGRRHALIEYKEHAYWITDQGSINGTFVNGQPISGATRLKHGDCIKLHKYEFDFEMPDMEAAGMTVISHTVLATAKDRSDDQTVAKTSRPAGKDQSTSTSVPDFDFNEMETGGSADATAAAPKDQDETIMLDTDDSDSSNTDATMRPDLDDAEDLTDDKFQERDKPD